MNASSSKTKIKDWLREAAARLDQAGIGSARLDCLILLENVTGQDRSWLLANPEHALTAPQIKKLDYYIARRAKHEPLAYIRGFTEFYGRRFEVDRRVLEPRPESETMIELLKELAESQKLKVKSRLIVADVGTGSGALAVTAALEIPRAYVVATDIDKQCLKIAASNAQKHTVVVRFFQGDLLAPIPSTLAPGVIMANLPYVPDSYKINQAAAKEPRTAIFGGPDGLEIYRRLFSGLPPSNPDFMLTESLPPQHRKLAAIAKLAGYRLMKTDGFIQVFALSV